MRELELLYAESITVLGVHSAKFPHERANEAVERAVRRHLIRHPVVNDRDFVIWQQYSVRAWPTLMFVDPLGRVFARHEGEFAAEQLAPVIERMLSDFDEQHGLNRRVLDFGVAGPAISTGPTATTLSFPGNVAIDSRGNGHVFLADSNHHRVVVTGLKTVDGTVHHIIGSGEPGLRDGPAWAAKFNWPQGMAVDPVTGTVYVADTENHAIRRISTTDGSVTTLAGTGQQARSPISGGPALRTDLSSPWDLALLPDPKREGNEMSGLNLGKEDCDDRGILFIAMAGSHQIWVLDLVTGMIRLFAGTGHEDIVDGPRQESSFAQPSGLAIDLEADILYVADSETSAVRTIHLGSDLVETLVGRGLFDFGDTDGSVERVRFQHPLGVCLWPDAPGGPGLLVADTYNHKIKLLDLQKREARTLLGVSGPGVLRDGIGKTAGFSEPGGLALSSDKLFIADTNNHALRIVELATLAVTTVSVDASRRAHQGK